MNIYKIKAALESANAEKGKAHHYFSRDNMKFFGQTLKCFKVNSMKAANGLPYYYFYAPITNKRGEKEGTTQAYFFPDEPAKIYSAPHQGEENSEFSQKLISYGQKSIL